MKISVVVSIYNDQDTVAPFLSRIQPILHQFTSDYEIIFSVDPSPDRTVEYILAAHQQDRRIKLLEFSRRFGQQMATLAGLGYSSGDAVIVMDADLQDPPEVIPEMIAKWHEGYDVVYGQRRSRQGDTFIYRVVITVGYWVIKRMANNIDIPANAGDFRLMSRRVVQHIVRLKESHGFLRGLVAFVGFRQTSVIFDRPARQVGTAKYNRFFGGITNGFNGLFCFSNDLLLLSTWAGFIIAFFSFLVAFVYAIMKYEGFPFPLGNPTVVILILFIGGVQLISVGILGHYIGRIYDEVKERPKFIINKTVGFD